jgi:signal transduction histidine kinase
LDAAKSEFISIASHQLRTPLTVIKGYISMMLEGNFGVLTKPETESLEKVFSSNERLIQLVENLLNISRIESGRLQFDYKEVDLNKMVESVVEELSGNAKKKNLILEYKTPVKPLPAIKIDEEKIRQVVMNLIDNGIKYTKQGSVTIRLEQGEHKVKFSVADSGMGIKSGDIINLFKKFSRGTGTSLIHTEGTGLGLYVARMMIEAHHGKIWAESDGEGKGSRFCFELPVK